MSELEATSGYVAAVDIQLEIGISKTYSVSKRHRDTPKLCVAKESNCVFGGRTVKGKNN